MEHPMYFGGSAGNRAPAPVTRSYGVRAADDSAGSTTLEFAYPDSGRKNYRVLLAHDLTGPSEIALVRAARLALERNGHLTILHVVNSELPAPVIEAQRADAKTYLEREARRWCYKGPYRVDIGIGDPAGAIAARAQAHNVNLVVTGRHQRRAFADMFTPSTVGRLLRQTQRPILVVSNSDQSPYRRVLIPTDLTNASAARIQFAATFLPQASLRLLHAYQNHFQDYIRALLLTCSRAEERGKSPDSAKQQRSQALSWLIETLRLGERRPIVMIENGNVLALVKQELARQKTELVVLGTDLRSGVEHAPTGSAAEALLRSSPCDVLFSGATPRPS
jgi:universal stress protein E